MPGRNFNYPFFKGYYADFHWVRLATNQGPITVATDTEGLFLGLFRPRNARFSINTFLPPPKASLLFLNAIPPIGTKSKRSWSLGPASQKTEVNGSLAGTLYFRFGE